MTRTPLAAVFTVLLLAAAQGLAQSLADAEDAAASQAEQLVEELGSKSYFTRQRATRQLGELGITALAAVERGAKSSDREIRYACQRLLADIHEADLKRRLAAFVEGRDEDAGEPLPFWKAYKELVGESPASRKLFAEMFTSEGELLASVQQNPRKAPEVVAERTRAILFDLAQLNHARQEVELATVASLLLVAGDEEVSVPDRTAQEVYTYCYQRSVQMELDDGPYKAEIRKLLGRWIARGEGLLAHNGLSLALQHGFEEGLIPARRIINDRRTYSYFLPEAVAAVARLGDKSHIALLEPLLADDTPVTQRSVARGDPFGRPLVVQVRDVALAGAVHLSGQDFDAYHFKFIQPNPLTVFTPNSACFASDDDRAAALEKWREYRAKQTDKDTDDAREPK
jgi:hypothetical protein